MDNKTIHTRHSKTSKATLRHALRGKSCSTVKHGYQIESWQFQTYWIFHKIGNRHEKS